MSFVLVLSSFTMIAYASEKLPGETERHYRWRQAYEGTKPIYQALEEDNYMPIAYAISQIGAIVKNPFDFMSYAKNASYFDDQYLNDNISVGEDLSLSFSDNFMKQLKQALKDYAKETDNSYYYVWSTGFDDIPYTSFGSFKPAYDTVKNVLDTIPGGTMKLAMFGKVTNGKYHFCISISQVPLSEIGFVHANGGASTLGFQYSYSTWEQVSPDVYVVVLDSDSPAISSWEEFKSRSLGVNQFPRGWDVESYDQVDTFASNASMRLYSAFNSETLFGRVNRGGSNGFMSLTTRSRATFRMYRSSDEFFDYTLGKRHVYFTNGFWNTDPGEITASLDDLANATDRMNDTLEKLLDKIDDNTDEKTIEELLQQILDEMKNQGSGGDTGGGTGGGGSGSGSSWSDGMIGSLFGYLEEIIDELGIMIGQLDWIGVTLEDMTVEQVEDKTDSFIDQLVSTFREVSDLLKTKFPFSIPWDLQDLLAVLGGDTVEVRASDGEIRTVNAYHAVSVVPVVLSDDDPGGGGTSRPGSDGGGGHSRGDPVSTMGTSDNGAPVFKLPLYIESAGIDEEIIVDMSPFEWLSKLSRGFLTILFCLGLMHLTFRVIDLGKILGLNDNA